MTPDRWERINAVFSGVCGLDPPRRASFLSDACAGDDSLGREIEELLECDARCGRDGFLDVPFVGHLPLAAVRTGRRVGPYQLGERIGGGGMGEVYRATRIDDYQQEVAIKFIRPGLDTAAMIERFQRERQVLASLQHPNITRLLDGGTTPDGLPFLVMEYVDGSPIDNYCEQRGLSARERARLMRDVCLAVHDAHEHGVIHRDLKPANVLVAGDTPKLMDFGLAKDVMSANQGETKAGQILGTPNYMSPEQAAGGTGVGRWTDVHALGGLLYVLLTGRAPFHGPSIPDTLEQVARSEPIALSRLEPRVPRDLETICLKCLRKEPGQRYSSALAVADDLTRYLDGKPILARPVGGIERLARWSRRNPRVAALSAALAVVLVVGFTAITTLWLTARAEEREAHEQRERAERKQEIARRAVEDMVRVAEKQLATQPRMTNDQLELLEKALAFYEELGREHGNDSAIRFRMAQLHHFIGRTKAMMGRPAEAEQSYRAQLAILEELAIEHPNESRYAFDLFHCRRELSNAVSRCGRDREAEELIRQALCTIEALTRDFPSEPLYRDALSHQHANVAQAFARRRQFDEAIRHHEAGLAIAEQLVREHPGRTKPPYFASNIVYHLGNLGGVYLEMGRRDDAEKAWRRQLEASQRLADEHPESPHLGMEVIAAANTLGDYCSQTGRPKEAESFLQRALATCRKLADDFPEVWHYRLRLVKLQHQFAQAQWDATSRDAAEASFRKAIALAELLIESFPKSPEARAELADILASCPIRTVRDTRRSRVLAAEAQQLSPDQPAIKLVLGIACYRDGDLEGCLNALKSADDPSSPIQARFYRAMARARLGDEAGGRSDFEFAQRILRQSKWQDRSTRQLVCEAAEVVSSEQ